MAAGLAVTAATNAVAEPNCPDGKYCLCVGADRTGRLVVSDTMIVRRMPSRADDRASSIINNTGMDLTAVFEQVLVEAAGGRLEPAGGGRADHTTADGEGRRRQSLALHPVLTTAVTIAGILIRLRTEQSDRPLVQASGSDRLSRVPGPDAVQLARMSMACLDGEPGAVV
ncbi:peptidase inhibitor family I36 protein [Lentzea sp. NPDC102401]|uniref:peptidase inhibitor family I36 protein n=1 Tax=Lentzea sp. NPDC102401 TaxID=3364128 RepID=UPI00380BEF0C